MFYPKKIVPGNQWNCTQDHCDDGKNSAYPCRDYKKFHS